MASLDTLIAQVSDQQLRRELEAAATDLRKTAEFGLVFERHIPESVRLPYHPIRRGLKVALRAESTKAVHLVVKAGADTVDLRRVRHDDGTPVPASDEPELTMVPRTDVVAVAEFGEPIYPGLTVLGEIGRGGDKPSHVVVKGENHHVLESLRFTHSGRVTACYIDPPYNSGARDWKYGNDYVDSDDDYRHSKWLAFMERRLRIAKDLLNPDESLLVVTIDEKEVHRLGLLLEQVFRGSRVQMVSITISPRGTSRANEFSRIDEYALFVFIGSAGVTGAASGEDAEVRWQYLRRDERTSTRESGRPNQWYPIYVNDDTLKITGVGDPLPIGTTAADAEKRDGCTAVFPVKANGTEMVWGLTGGSLMPLVDGGFVRVTRSNTNEHQPYTISYLRGAQRNLASGRYKVIGERDDGTKIVVIAGGRVQRPTTVWREKAHDAGAYGTSLIGAFIPGRHFPFPKSLYAVEDTLRTFLADKPDAVVLDFFGGSGTTTHAVARLNRQDGGNRQTILVTNNEVSPEEAAMLTEAGYQPGDPEWEAEGIFDLVTRPRITAAVTGLRPDGDPVEGDYKFVDEGPFAEGFDENVTFLELTYQDAARIELDQAFNAIAPLLWMRAGATGPVLEESHDTSGRRKPYAWTDRYGVLFNTDRWSRFVERMPDTVTTAFIVTDSITTFATVAAELPDHVDAVRLYERYLTTFAITG